MTITVSAPDGIKLEFPDGTSDEEIDAAVLELDAQAGTPHAVAQPGTITAETIPRSIKEGLIEETPQVAGGIAGGLAAGAVLTTGGGPLTLGAVAVTAAGVYFGAAAGEAMKQIGQHLSGSPAAPKTSLEAAKRIGKAGAEEGFWETIGGLGIKGFQKIIAPFDGTMKEGAEEVIDYFKGKIDPIVLKPSESNESRVLGLVHNVTDSSLLKTKAVSQYEGNRAKFFDDFADSMIDQYGERAGAEDLGNLLVTSLDESKGIHNGVSKVVYNNLYADIARYDSVAEDAANTVDMSIKHSNFNELPGKLEEFRKNPTFYRGTIEGASSQKPIREDFYPMFGTGEHRAIWVSKSKKEALNFGPNIEKITPNKDAKILYEGTPEFGKVVGINKYNPKVPLEDHILGDKMQSANIEEAKRSMMVPLEDYQNIIQKAKDSGYDAVSFAYEEIGTIILNEDKFKRAVAGGVLTKPLNALSTDYGHDLLEIVIKRLDDPGAINSENLSKIADSNDIEVNEVLEWIGEMDDELQGYISKHGKQAVLDAFSKISDTKIGPIGPGVDDAVQILKSSGINILGARIKYGKTKSASITLEETELPANWKEISLRNGITWKKDPYKEVAAQFPEIGSSRSAVSFSLGNKSESDTVRKWTSFAREMVAKPERGVRMPTDTLRTFASKLRVIADELGSIEAKNAGDDLVSAVMDLPETLSIKAAIDLRSRLISRVDEFKVINKNAPAIGKARKMITLVDEAIEKTLKGLDKKGGSVLTPPGEGQVTVYHGRVGGLGSGSRHAETGVHFSEDPGVAVQVAVEGIAGARWTDGVAHATNINPDKFIELPEWTLKMESMESDPSQMWGFDNVKEKIIESMQSGRPVPGGINFGGNRRRFPFSKAEVDKLTSTEDFWALMDEKGLDGIKYINEVEGEAGNMSYIINPKTLSDENVVRRGLRTEDIDEEMSGLADRFRTAEGTSPYKTWRMANHFYKTGQQRFNNTFLRRMIKLADESGTGAETIAPKIFIPGRVSNVRKVKRALHPEDWKTMQSFFMQHLLQKSSNVEGEIIGKRILNNMHGKPNSFGMPMIREILNPNQIKELNMFANTLKMAQSEPMEATGKMLIQMSQAGMAGTLFTQGLELPAATVIFGPAIVGRLMLQPHIVRLLTTGVQMPASSPAAAGLLARVIAASERVINHKERPKGALQRVGIPARKE